MAESERSTTTEPGAPIPRDAVDPDLIKLTRPRAKIGLLTSAGMVFLCAFFLWRLTPDRRFGGEPDAPRLVAIPDVIAGKVGRDAHVALEGEPMISHAIRATKAAGDPGMRVTPVRGSGERVWLVLDGVGWDPPTIGRYTGRLRPLADMPFGDAVRQRAAAEPRAVFATATAIRAGLTAGKITTVDGDSIAVRDTDRVAFDVVDPNVSTIIATFTPGTPEHTALLDEAAWAAELVRLGIIATPAATDPRDQALGQARFDAAMPITVVTQKLEGAKLWAARVESVTRHHETTWGALKRSSPSGFTIGTTTIPDAQLDLAGVYVTRPIPDGAYALLIAERPQDYWYILPITIVVGIIGLLFLWTLIRTVRRDVLPTSA
ncbi:MAG: hypothetical protein M3619_03360 [Myxococcota bacterium]|nr:hypothetical protein [Myxococcota bacterium]